MKSLSLSLSVTALALASRLAPPTKTTQLVDPAEVEADEAEVSACPALPAPVHHRVKPSNNASLYTLSASEASNAGTNHGFTDNRGTAFYASAGAATGLARVLPVQRVDPELLLDDRRERARQRPVALRLRRSRRELLRVEDGAAVPGARLSLPQRLAGQAPVRGDAGAAGRAGVGRLDERGHPVLRGAGGRLPPPPPPPPNDPKFSFIVIPDTQQEIVYRPELFNNRVSWIVNNKTSQDIRFVTHTGDMVDWDTPDHIHYVRARDGLRPLNTAGIPYAIAVGNHDTAAVCVGGARARAT